MKTSKMVGGFLVSILLCTPILPAAQLNVGPGETYTTIQSAIDAAVAPYDEVIVAPGVYDENINFVGKAIIVRGTNPLDWDVVESTVIAPSAGVASVELTSGEGEDSVLEGLTVSGSGVGIYCNNSTITMKHCVIRDNESFGVYAYQWPIYITNCIIRDNDNYGLRFYWCAGLIANCVITGNAAGGISSSWAPIINCTIANNDGYGIYDCYDEIVNCIIWGNPAGALYNCAASYSCYEGASNSYGNISEDPMLIEPRIGECRLWPGSPCIDAGVDSDPGVDIPVSDVDGNARPIDGDGDETAGTDMGAYEYVPDQAPYIILSTDELEFTAFESGGNPPEQSFEINNPGYEAINWEIASDCTWATVEPDSGATMAEPNTVVVHVDVTGLSGGQEHLCDLTVTAANAINNPRTLTVRVYVGGIIAVPSDFSTIQEAIDQARDGDTIVVAQGVYKENLNFSGKAIKLCSSDPYDWDVVKSTVIDGDYYYGSCVVFDHGEGNDSVLEGFTLTNGTGIDINYDAGTQTFYGQAGGGIYCWNSSPTIRRCNITFNGYKNTERYEANVRLGGGIAIIGSSEAVIDNCFVTDNIANYYGAGIIILGPPSESACKILNCTVANNEIGYWDSYLDFQWYDVDCWATETTVENTIIWSPYNRSLHISDPGLVSHCCLQSAYLYQGHYYNNSLPIEMAGPNGNIYGDPGFVKRYERWFDEGEDGDYHLRLDSICIDRGDPGFDGAGKRDVDGQARVMGRTLDIGADEVVPTITLGKPSGGEVWAAGSRHAIEWHNSHWKRLYICNAGFEESQFPEPQITHVTEDGLVPGWEVGPLSGAAIASFDYYPHPGGRITGFDRGSGLYQGLGDAYLPETTYTLTVDIGSRKDWTGEITAWQAALTVDDRDTIVAQTDHTIDGIPEKGGWLKATVSYTTGAEGVDPLVGRQIGVLLSSPPRVYYDNVKIDIDEANPETVDISSSTDGGDNWAVVEGGAADSGSYSWQLPEGADSNDCLLKIEPTDEPNAIEYIGFDSPFTIRTGQPGDPVASRWPTLGGNFRRSGLSGDTGPRIGCVKWTFGASSPVGHWRLDETEGLIAADSAAEPHDGMLMGMSAGAWVAGNHGGALQFDGVDDFVEITGFAGVMSGQSRTVCAWIRTNTPERVIVAWGLSGTAAGRWLFATNGTGQLRLEIGGGFVEGTAAVCDGAWHHVTAVLTDDGSPNINEVRLYVDGVADAPSWNESDRAINTLAGGDVKIGQYLAARFFEGTIDEVRIYDRPLSAEDILSVMSNATAGGPVHSSVAIGAQDRIHIGSDDGKVYTVDSEGSLVWIFETGSALMSSPSVGPDGTVYVGCRDGRLYAIDKDGGLRWVHDAEGMVHSTPAVDETGRLFFGSSDGNIYALGADGSELWSFEVPRLGAIGNSVLVSPSVGADGSIYAGGLFDSKLYCLDPASGNVNWSHDFEYTLYQPGHPDYEVVRGSFFASPIVGDDGTIYVSLLYDSNLYAVDPNDGTVEWSIDMHDTVASTINPAYSDEYKQRYCWSEPAVAPDGTIYVSFDDPYLRAVNPDGSIRWVSRIGMVGGFTLSVDREGMIYAASDDGSLYVINPDGEEVGRFDGGGWLSYPVIGADGTVYVSDTENMLWAISLDACEGAGYDLHRRMDIDGNGIVNLADFALLAGDWPGGDGIFDSEARYRPGDVNRDCYILIDDVAEMAGEWLYD